MPLSANGFDAWIVVGDDEAEFYAPELLEEPSGYTSWIASELGKEFSIHWRNTDVFCQTVGRVWVDGIECSGEILLGPNMSTRVSGRRTTGSALSPFLFSTINFTDDDDFVDITSSRDIGLIKLELWTINMTGTKPFTDNAPVAESKVHERSKKGVAHQTKFGEPVQGNMRSAAIVEYLETFPIVTFTFKYRSLDILQANGIAPASVRPAKRKSGTVKLEEMALSKRLKREPLSVGRNGKSSEVIDLTRDSNSPPATAEVIDLT
ncbi:hypothetical protein MIND_00105900 [Mycena indigotica]|uniref:DUF7918 domain-containing protein n=1 Tax=Mycena indigotica TaxID=2126181 RepID=A0A8H6TDX4_9AGAR|nr:uncharacterized protein MIND_00105900 [Mycena indigotica]KAF7315893.1 hypothetical protein MIND_00105900 [Mycena indigotica]